MGKARIFSGRLIKLVMGVSLGIDPAGTRRRSSLTTVVACSVPKRAKQIDPPSDRNDGPRPGGNDRPRPPYEGPRPGANDRPRPPFDRTRPPTDRSDRTDRPRPPNDGPRPGGNDRPRPPHPGGPRPGGPPPSRHGDARPKHKKR